MDRDTYEELVNDEATHDYDPIDVLDYADEYDERDDEYEQRCESEYERRLFVARQRAEADAIEAAADRLVAHHD